MRALRTLFGHACATFRALGSRTLAGALLGTRRATLWLSCGLTPCDLLALIGAQLLIVGAAMYRAALALRPTCWPLEVGRTPFAPFDPRLRSVLAPPMFAS